MDSRLELRLADASPKCATCASYHELSEYTHAGRCMLMAKGLHPSAGPLVLDLSVCTGWTERLELEAVKE